MRADHCHSGVRRHRSFAPCRPLPLTAVPTTYDCLHCDQTTVGEVDAAWPGTVEVSWRAAVCRPWTTGSRRPHCPMKRPDWRCAVPQAVLPARRGGYQLLQRPRRLEYNADDKRRRIRLRRPASPSCHISTSSFNRKTSKINHTSIPNQSIDSSRD